MRSRAHLRVALPSLLMLSVAALFSVMTVACSRSDADVQEELQKALASDSATSGAHLTVTVTKGVARLAGETDTKAQQDRAVDIARAIKGISQVEPAMRLNDAALTQAVKTAVAANPSVNAVPLRIEVHEGEVRLFSDQTNADQRATLVAIARGVDGVSQVEDDMK